MKLSKLLISIFCLSILSAPMLYPESKKNKLPELPLKQDYNYFEIGLSFIFDETSTMGYLPTLGLGTRIQKGSHGVDFKLQVSSVLFVTNGTASIKWLFFPKPNLKHQ